MFPESPGEFKTRFVILEARAHQIQSQNFNPTRSIKKQFAIAQCYSIRLWVITRSIIVVKAGGLFCQISCTTGCRSKRKKPFKITC